MEKSTHQALCVPIELIKHPNADALSICRIDDYTVVARTEDWIGKTKAVYICPDTLVDITMPQFNFLAKDAKYTQNSQPNGPYARIRAKKLRGVQSYGLLAQCDETTPLGTDFFELWKLGRYESSINSPTGGFGFVTSGEVASPPELHFTLPKYDVEGGNKWARKVFIEGERTILTLKYHGSSGCWVYINGEFHCRSRTEFKKEFASPPKADKDKLIAKLGEEKGLEVFNKIQEKQQNWTSSRNLWWRVLRENEWLQRFCQDNPGVFVFGEVIGVQGTKFLYGMNPGEVSVRVFDLMKDGVWMDYEPGRELGKDLKWVRVLNDNFPFNMNELIKFVETMGVYDNVGGYEEGVVIKPISERWNEYIGRTQVKLINPVYLEKS
jgi:RNA ligase (TIGR02306 family)